MDIVQSLNWRYATKKFDSTRKISDQDWSVLEESMRLSPSSYGLQPWKIYVITDQAIKDKLVPFSWNQQQVADCSHLVVIAFKEKIDNAFVDKNIEAIAAARGVDVSGLQAYTDLIKKNVVEGLSGDTVDYWAQRQCYILMGFLLFAAAQLKIDSCPMEGIEPAKYDEIINVDEDFKTVAAVPLGYRASDDPYSDHEKVRFSKNDVFAYIK